METTAIITVSQVVEQSTQKKVWLCPSYVSYKTFHIHRLLKGIECTPSTVPVKLRDMKVEKHFTEDGFICIIWINDGRFDNDLDDEEVLVTS